MSFRAVKKIFILGRLQNFSQNMGEAKEKNMENVTGETKEEKKEEKKEEEEVEVGNLTISEARL